MVLSKNCGWGVIKLNCKFCKLDGEEEQVSCTVSLCFLCPIYTTCARDSSIFCQSMHCYLSFKKIRSGKGSLNGGKYVTVMWIFITMYKQHKAWCYSWPSSTGEKIYSLGQSGVYMTFISHCASVIYFYMKKVIGALII